MDTLSRALPKEPAHDYLERDLGSDAALVSRLVVSQCEKERTADRELPNTASLETNDLDAKQQAAAERWATRQKNSPTAGQGASRTPAPTLKTPDLELKRERDYDRGGPEDDL
jgi:hypothetical protein